MIIKKSANAAMIKVKKNNNKNNKFKKKKNDEKWNIIILAYNHHSVFVAMMILTSYICFNNENVFVKHNFFKRWILNFDCNQHMIENFNAFISFIFLVEKIINNVENNFVVINIDSIRLYVKIKNESSHIIIHNVWYVFNSKYNLLFYNMFKNVEIFMIIKDYNFEIDSQKTCAVKNENLYFFVFETFTTLFVINLLTLFIFVNEITY